MGWEQVDSCNFKESVSWSNAIQLAVGHMSIIRDMALCVNQPPPSHHPQPHPETRLQGDEVQKNSLKGYASKLNRCASHQTFSFLSCIFLRNMTTNTIMSFETAQIKLCCFTVWHRLHAEGWVLRTNLPYTQWPLKYKIQQIRFFFCFVFSPLQLSLGICQDSIGNWRTLLIKLSFIDHVTKTNGTQ